MKNFNFMNAIQLLGRSLMLPIAVLPVAGILMRLGQQDLLDVYTHYLHMPVNWVPYVAAISKAGAAIFDNLPLIFAIGVAIGVAKDNHGAAALAGATAFLILMAMLKSLNPNINMGVLGGIISGIMAGLYYNRFKDIKLPEYLAFFGGRRFVPIISGATAILLGFAFSIIWPPIQSAIDWAGHLMIESGGFGLFIYGVLNRLLIVTGLHHIINNLVWFQFGSYTDAAGAVIHGDLYRFFAGDKTAGSFMAGMFPVMMFGLPGVALAMYRCAKPERRSLVGGLLFSLALTSFLTGITEPIEFSFMFLSPLLYAIHAFLTGASMVIMWLLHVKLGFTFSAGAFDYVLSYGIATNPLMLIPVGFVYFFLYYFIFSWAIKHFNLKVIGREDDTAAARSSAQDAVGAPEQIGAYVRALGGADNLTSIGACTTRLRLVVNDQSKIDENALKALGAMAVMKLRDGNVQVIVGPIADNVAEDMRQHISAGGGKDVEKTPVPTAVELPVAVLSNKTITEWLKALGGKANIKNISNVATTRLRVEVADEKKTDTNLLQSLGAEAVTSPKKGLIHIIFPDHELPSALAKALS